jgi:hypothetical protein
MPYECLTGFEKEGKSRIGAKRPGATAHFDVWRKEIQFQLKLVLRNTQSDAGLNINQTAGNLILKNGFRMQMDFHYRINISLALAPKTKLTV